MDYPIGARPTLAPRGHQVLRQGSSSLLVPLRLKRTALLTLLLSRCDLLESPLSDHQVSRGGCLGNVDRCPVRGLRGASGRLSSRSRHDCLFVVEAGCVRRRVS